jgi:hypothetical protein
VKLDRKVFPEFRAISDRQEIKDCKESKEYKELGTRDRKESKANRVSPVFKDLRAFKASKDFKV